MVTPVCELFYLIVHEYVVMIYVEYLIAFGKVFLIVLRLLVFFMKFKVFVLVYYKFVNMVQVRNDLS